MLKFLKEIIIMLLLCLVLILLLAVIFYEYIPARKVTSQVTQYVPSAKISQQLSDNIDNLNTEVLLTFEQVGYEVTSSDLNRYKITEDYVPGKANPFAAESSRATANDQEKSGTSGSTSSEKSSSTTQSGESEYIKNKGTK